MKRKVSKMKKQWPLDTTVSFDPYFGEPNRDGDQGYEIYADGTVKIRIKAPGAKEVIITHNTEVIVYDGKDFYSVPIRARNLSGRTGRGDTTFAAYMTERLTHSIEHSLLYATATVSIKMETPGPYKGTRADIENYIDEFYSDIK